MLTTFTSEKDNLRSLKSFPSTSLKKLCVFLAYNEMKSNPDKEIVAKLLGMCCLIIKVLLP